MKRESKIEREFFQYAKTWGCKALKFITPTEDGNPDRIVIGPGFLFWIEFKRPGEEPRKKQLKRIKELRDMGQDVYVCDNLTDAQNLLIVHLNLSQNAKA